MSQAKAKPLLLPQRRQLILPQGFRDRRKLPDVRPAPWIWVPKRFAPRMAVAVDSTGTGQSKTTAATTQTYTGLSIGAGLTNAAATFVVFAGQAAGGAVGATFSATYNGVACTQIIRRDFGNTLGSLAVFGIVLGNSPASGVHNFIITTTNLCVAAIQGTSWTGVDQTGGTTSFPNSNFFDSNPSLISTHTLTITTANGNATHAIASCGGTTPITFTPGNTYDDTGGTQGGNDILASQNLSTGTSITYTATQSSSDFIVIAGADIKASAGADTLEGGQSVFHMRRKSIGWTPLYDPRARVLFRQRRS